MELDPAHDRLVQRDPEGSGLTTIGQVRDRAHVREVEVREHPHGRNGPMAAAGELDHRAIRFRIVGRPQDAAQGTGLRLPLGGLGRLGEIDVADYTSVVVLGHD